MSVELEQTQSNSTWHYYVCLIGMANQKAQFVAFVVLIKPFEAKTRHIFFIFDILIALATKT